MEEIKCIFCDTYDNPVVIKENGYQARRCQACGLIYVSPRPTFAQIKNLYEDDNAQMTAKSHISVSSFHRLYEKHHLKIIKKFKENGAILEIGSGSGSFLDEARKQGFDVFAIEQNRIQVDFIRNSLNIPCEGAELSDSSFGKSKFDIVYHRDVTSHFYDPIKEFKQMNVKLKDGGLLIFETGFYGDNRYINLFLRHQLPDHLFTFSNKNLAQLLDKTGFKVLKIYRYSSLPVLFVNKALKPMMDSVKQKGKYSFNKASDTADFAGHKNNREPFLVRLLRILYLYFFHFLRYKIGYFFPKGNGPQKVIIIAKKA